MAPTVYAAPRSIPRQTGKYSPPIGGLSPGKREIIPRDGGNGPGEYQGIIPRTFATHPPAGPWRALGDFLLFAGGYLPVRHMDGRGNSPWSYGGLFLGPGEIHSVGGGSLGDMGA